MDWAWTKNFGTAVLAFCVMWLFLVAVPYYLLVRVAGARPRVVVRWLYGILGVLYAGYLALVSPYRESFFALDEFQPAMPWLGLAVVVGWMVLIFTYHRRPRGAPR